MRSAVSKPWRTVFACAIALLETASGNAAHAAENVDGRAIAAKESSPPHARLWARATEAAAARDWRQAGQLGKRAFALHLATADEDWQTTCQMLDSLSCWHANAREFPAALAAARELLERRRRHFTDDYWETIDARLQVELVERLSKLDDDQWRAFLSADQLSAEASILFQSRKYASAIDRAERALASYSKVFGRNHPVTQNCLTNLAVCHFELGQYAKVKPYLEEIVGLDPDPRGLMHPDTLRSLNLLANFNAAIGDLTNAEAAAAKVVEIDRGLYGDEHPQTTIDRVELAKLLADGRKFDEAKSILVPALEAQRKQLGDEHPATAQTMKILGLLHAEQGDFAAAEKLLDRCVESFARFAATNRLPIAGALNARGRARMLAGKPKEAHADLIASLEMCQQQLGDGHPTTAKVLANLAELYESGANLGMARQIRLLILAVAEETFGESNPLTVDALEHVARLYLRMNDFSLAEPYLLRVRESHRKLDGEQHPKTAEVISQLALVYLGTGDPQRAKPLFEEALAIFDGAHGPDSLQSAEVHKQLGLLYQSEGRCDEAERHYRRALQALEAQKADDLQLAAVQIGLAQTLLSRGKIDQACQLADQFIAVYSERLQGNDPQWFDALGIAGTAWLATGKFDKARELFARGLQIASLRRRMTGAFESERQRLMQMRFARSMLDLYLSLPASLHTAGPAMYPHVLDWKGAIAMRQWSDRQQSSKESAALMVELRQVVRKLATLNLRCPAPEDRESWIRQLFDLNMRKESLEQQLAVESASADTRSEELRVADLKRILPPDAALVDIVQYVRTSFEGPDGSRKLLRTPSVVAFVVRPNHEIARVDLGDVDPIGEAVVNWRMSRGFRPNAGKTDWAARIGELIWPKLKPFVGDCQTLLVSPDGVLAQLAWGALPGNRPDCYLLENYEIAMVPVPQLLARRCLDGAAANMGDSLLLIGDVDFDAPPEAAAARSNRHAQFHFGPLPGTAAETESLHDQFVRSFPRGSATLLQSADATEANFWREAPRHRWLHVATHGFFAPANIKTALATQHRMDANASPQDGVSIFHRDYLNGLALSGANVGSADDGDDGILTAAELATMDLRNLDLAVLSGCETGLGQIQPGEGAFGIQRALQMAGVKSTVGSFWTVSDKKTNLLMQRFYSNLWEKKLGKLAALREAQLWMLNTGGESSANSPPGKPIKRTSPHYWAAFTLSGDWR
jgi:CHAT domain-containing protein/tetratricopeptide (TPR) repeat protein